MNPTQNAIIFFIAIAISSGCSRRKMGTGGQYEDSPDQSYRASASGLQDGNSIFMTYEIQEKASGIAVWRLETTVRRASMPPYGAGFGNFDYIQWSTDSAEVRFAFKCENTTDVLEWLAVRADDSGEFVSPGRISDSGYLYENRLKR